LPGGRGGWQSWWISLAKGGEQPGAGCRDDERAGRDTQLGVIPISGGERHDGLFEHPYSVSVSLRRLTAWPRRGTRCSGSNPTNPNSGLQHGQGPAPYPEWALIEASEIFRRIGVEIEWVDGSSRQRLGSSELYLRIIPRLFPNTRCPFGPSHLGYAATSEEGGVLATIFFHHVEELTRGADPSFALGYAIAHELGHLLLGNGRRNGGPHSASGLMRAPWQRADLKREARETMQFTPEDAGRLRGRFLEQSRKSNDLQAPPSLFTEIETSDPGVLFR